MRREHERPVSITPVSPLPCTKKTPFGFMLKLPRARALVGGLVLHAALDVEPNGLVVRVIHAGVHPRTRAVRPRPVSAFRQRRERAEWLPLGSAKNVRCRPPWDTRRRDNLVVDFPRLAIRPAGGARKRHAHGAKINTALSRAVLMFENR